MRLVEAFQFPDEVKQQTLFLRFENVSSALKKNTLLTSRLAYLREFFDHFFFYIARRDVPYTTKRFSRKRMKRKEGEAQPKQIE